MKKSIALICVCAVLLGVFATACSSGSKSSGSSSSSKKYTIANVPKMVGIAWWNRMQVGNETFQKQTGDKVFQVGATTADAADQIKTLQDVIAQKVDAITVCPVDPIALGPILKKARDQGIVVISHEATTISNVNYDVEAFQNADYGAHLMDNLAKLMGDKGDYAIMVGSLTMLTHQQWAAGAEAEQKAKYPNMHLVTSIVGASTQDASYSTAKELLSAYPSLKGMIGMDTLNVPGIAQAIGEEGLSGKVFVTGTCLPSTIKQYFADNSCQVSSGWDPAMAGEAMCKIAVMVLNKQPITNGMDLGVAGYNNIKIIGHVVYGSAMIDITKDNVDTFGF